MKALPAALSIALLTATAACNRSEPVVGNNVQSPAQLPAAPATTANPAAPAAGDGGKPAADAAGDEGSNAPADSGGKPAADASEGEAPTAEQSERDGGK